MFQQALTTLLNLKGLSFGSTATEKLLQFETLKLQIKLCSKQDGLDRSFEIIEFTATDNHRSLTADQKAPVHIAGREKVAEVLTIVNTHHGFEDSLELKLPGRVYQLRNMTSKFTFRASFNGKVKIVKEFSCPKNHFLLCDK